MRRRALTISAIISLLFLAVVLAAIFSSAAFEVGSNYPNTAPPIVELRIFKLHRGQFEFFRIDDPSVSSLPVGKSYVYRWDGIWMPGGRMLTGFALHRSPLSQSMTSYFAFPLWILAAPFLIAPARWLWLWRRERRERQMDGSRAFPVGFEK